MSADWIVFWIIVGLLILFAWKRIAQTFQRFRNQRLVDQRAASNRRRLEVKRYIREKEKGTDAE